MTDFLEACRNGDVELPTDTLWICGGEQIYRQAMPYCDEVVLTHVAGSYDGDTFFPPFEEAFEMRDEIPGEGFSWRTYVRKE